ncbi:Cytochrome P450 703A2 [Glycine max]|nr:Cytochrome P450 703A2 [Glycine max]
MDLTTFISTLFLATLASKIILHWLIVRFLSSHKNKLPSSPPRWPIIVGNLLQLWQLSYRDLASLCNKYGPIVYLKLDKIDVITTNDFDIIRKILLSQDDVFASRPHTLVVVHLAYGCGDVALAPLGPHWKPMRRICMKHLLRRKRLESFSKHRLDEVQHLVKDVLVRAQDEKPINLREVLGTFSMNNVTRMLLAK